MARAQGARAQMALAFETVYGTPPAGGYTRVPFASTSLGSEQPLGRTDAAPAARSALRDGDFSPTGRADLAADRRLPRPDARARRRPNQRDRSSYSGTCAASGCVPMKCFSVA